MQRLSVTTTRRASEVESIEHTSVPEAILEVAAATFRPDNRLVLTYLPEGSTADEPAVDHEARDDETARDAADEEVAA